VSIVSSSNIADAYFAYLNNTCCSLLSQNPQPDRPARDEDKGSCAKAQLQDKHYGGCCGLRKVLNYNHPEKE